MEIIPVIDLMGSQAVHARGGGRSAYRPLESKLCKAADEPLKLIAAMLARYPFRQLYLADLDAILGTGRNGMIVRQIRQRFPKLRLWLDEGIRDCCALSRAYAENLATPVIGSESLRDLKVLTAPAFSPQNRTPILSLDFCDGRFLGPPRLMSDPTIWPKTVILMTLSRVGSGMGPDIVALRDISARSPRSTLYAAGGVRDADDLNRLQTQGISGVLVASALHNGSLSADAIARYY